ncbi:unnamed protein product [Ceutorhynchus assimilis]|uniref:tRNA/rRNA methyltransferase SpoU type domain-containing protein n=1 Tax=Ceutorhynchus assimilis TaxID=467358 RepID=A0A9N9MWD7_9CUCU|nr:unnamed protein product [Ceutorhynchus assimilis]
MARLLRNIYLFSCQQIRLLPRFSQFTPEKLAQENDVSDHPPPPKPEKHSKFQETECKRKPTFQEPRSLVIKPPKINPPTQKLKHVSKDPEPLLDQEGNLIYTKMQDEDSRILEIMSKLKNNKKNNLMLLEGKRLIKEALQTGCKMDYILFSRLKEVEYLKPYLPRKGHLYKMPYREMQVWSDLTTNPGIMGIFQIPSADLFEPKEALPLTIICDNVREPNNLGAILRTSSGVGCHKVILTKGCTNVWDSKVLRTACGAHFRVKISKETNWDEISNTLPDNSNVFIADNNILSSKNDESLQSMQDLLASIPILPYFSTDFKKPNHLVLIIGGETEGISMESYKLASKFNGARLNVPLSNGVESLNAGTALGIIVFEIKRQLMQKTN